MKVARHGDPRAGRWPVQLRYECNLTGEQYVTQSAWQMASLLSCPLHPEGGCGFARHGTYPRVTPQGTLIARWYCRVGHCTFSLLPDSLAARMPGTLAEVEAAINTVEKTPTWEKAALEIRPDIFLPGVLRWTRRRVKAVYLFLQLIKGLLPNLFSGCPISLEDFRLRPGVDLLLPQLREIAKDHLSTLPPPLGFLPPAPGNGESQQRFQQQKERNISLYKNNPKRSKN